jgi:DNA modification methylase
MRASMQLHGMKKKDNAMTSLGGLRLNWVHCGDCLALTRQLPAECVDVVVTSPPYWGQRTSNGVGVEADPRKYLDELVERFVALHRVIKNEGLLWINLGDAYNTPVNWREDDHRYSTLGPDKNGLDSRNSAYTKPRLKRRAFEIDSVPWLQYGNLLALPYRLAIALCDHGYLFRGEVI